MPYTDLYSSTSERSLEITVRKERPQATEIVLFYRGKIRGRVVIETAKFLEKMKKLVEEIERLAN